MATFEPLHVRASIPQQVAIPGGWLALDALLLAAAAARQGLPPLSVVPREVPLEIPLALEPGGRFHLASFARAKLVEYDRRHINRRPVIAEAQALGDRKFRRINLSTGPNKGYRIPMEVGFLEGGALEWWAVGNLKSVVDLLANVGAIGKKRSVGLGRVERWDVAPCEPWGHGFPLVRDGQPTRPLPSDWPGLSERGNFRYATLSPPYWEKHREEVLRVPE